MEKVPYESQECLTYWFLLQEELKREIQQGKTPTPVNPPSEIETLRGRLAAAKRDEVKETIDKQNRLPARHQIWRFFSTLYHDACTMKASKSVSEADLSSIDLKESASGETEALSKGREADLVFYRGLQGIKKGEMQVGVADLQRALAMCNEMSEEDVAECEVEMYETIFTLTLMKEDIYMWNGGFKHMLCKYDEAEELYKLAQKVRVNQENSLCLKCK